MLQRAAAALLLSSAVAHAGEVWKSKDESIVLEESGFVKPYVSWLHLQPSLLALAPLPSDVGLNTDTFRFAARVTVKEKVTFDLAYQLATVVASSPAFTASGSASYLGAALVAPQRRFIDFSPYLLSEGGFVLQHNLDRASVKYATDRFSLTVGRQVLSWGTGRLWNPTDLVSPFAPTDIDREVRRGADAVRASISLGATSQLELLWLPQQKAADNGGILRARTNLFGWDFSATAAKYVSDLVFGADAAGDLGPLGGHVEAAWTVPMNGIDDTKPLGLQQGFVRAVAGLDFRPSEKWVFTGEYYFNGFGAHSAAEILDKLRSDRVVRGEVFGAGRHYAGLLATFIANDVLTLSTTVLLNCTDPSVLIIPAVEYSLGEVALIRAGGFLPAGAGLDAATLTAHSEYGLSPFGAFVQLGLYLN